jgi:hypothetical protein
MEEGASPHVPLLPYAALHDDEIPVVQKVWGQPTEMPSVNLALELASATKGVAD